MFFIDIGCFGTNLTELLFLMYVHYIEYFADLLMILKGVKIFNKFPWSISEKILVKMQFTFGGEN